jgi:hypothetical protein
LETRSRDNCCLRRLARQLSAELAVIADSCLEDRCPREAWRAEGWCEVSLVLGRCLHCGDPLSPINYSAVCRDYPECVVLKGMFPLASEQNQSADLAGGDSTQKDCADQPGTSPAGGSQGGL